MMNITAAISNFMNAPKKGQPVCEPAVETRVTGSTNRDVIGSVHKENIPHLAGIEHLLSIILTMKFLEKTGDRK
jgi:hypothetical protein